MQDELIRKVAGLMTEQTSAYESLDSAATQLSVVMIQGESHIIDSLSKAGEKELLKMRSRLLEITTALTEFAELRARQTEKSPLDVNSREQFEAAAKSLLEAAKSFQKTAVRASSVALGGLSYSNACIQSCGLPPTTYSAPVLRYAEGAGR